ncbi:Flp pilus assembly protein CpaB [Cytobacillus sp. IB215665]|uniref:Flp pilus assembly protein CpaB n=1 Tax=Cytobacillus sp. IB215665 TaxID=3097357 RepID=UPI002A0E19CE|nr:RcpC/CpaB family pilus assembly protein [Cytobacillus sp. IB215665]MDX8367193.1 RcpC/CpaB family pilus assembly protein [Cytobacillus sp. IB215665]
MKLSTLAKKRILAGVGAVVVVTAFYFYNDAAVEQKISPVKVVFAKTDIPPHTQITEEMVFEKVVPGQAIPPNALSEVQQVIGKWTVDGYGVAKNSLVYNGKILDTGDMPDAAILNLEDGEYAFPLLVDLETSSGNAIRPNSYVDLYFVTIQDKKPLTGKLYERIRISTVKDSKTQNVFGAENYTESAGTSQLQSSQVASSSNNPSALAKLYTLAVTEEQLDLLTKAKVMGNIIPVANSDSYNDSVEGEYKLDKSMQEIHDYIETNSYDQKLTELENSVEQASFKVGDQSVDTNSEPVETEDSAVNNEDETVKGG